MPAVMFGDKLIKNAFLIICYPFIDTVMICLCQKNKLDR